MAAGIVLHIGGASYLRCHEADAVLLLELTAGRFRCEALPLDLRQRGYSPNTEVFLDKSCPCGDFHLPSISGPTHPGDVAPVGGRPAPSRLLHDAPPHEVPGVRDRRPARRLDGRLEVAAGGEVVASHEIFVSSLPCASVVKPAIPIKFGLAPRNPGLSALPHGDPTHDPLRRRSLRGLHVAIELRGGAAAAGRVGLAGAPGLEDRWVGRANAVAHAPGERGVSCGLA
eukprot:CAMPEP_0176185612 /NCGR_PEP_ID=MMETSP0121_2-20121125/1444_1 /TAXON_ID=160619 /ORGANISM="Kryptoperidinium foliaceum, Strain CCMP 1326" /LENGTH=227 /DNA_ID=CAMNT_0017524071 /DNA_START=275 /DNA_END=956 /DNA_ORIENTATION=+